MKLRIKEALQKYNKEFGTNLKQKDFAVKIWPNSKTPRNAQNKLSALINGRGSMIYPEEVKAICDVTGVDPNFLFGYESEENHSLALRQTVKIINQIIKEHEY